MNPSFVSERWLRPKWKKEKLSNYISQYVKSESGAQCNFPFKSISRSPARVRLCLALSPSPPLRLGALDYYGLREIFPKQSLASQCEESI